MYLMKCVEWTKTIISVIDPISQIYAQEWLWHFRSHWPLHLPFQPFDAHCCHMGTTPKTFCARPS